MPREITRAGRRSPWKRLQTSCLIYVRRGERKGNEERKSQPRGNGEMESKSEQRTERDGIDRPPAEYHFFHLRKFFTFPFSDHRRRRRRLSRRQAWDDRRREEFSLSSFPLLRADCMLSRCQTRRVVTRPVVCQPRREISLKAPSFLHSFFSSSPRCRRPSRRR